jgi:integrase
LDEGTLAMLRAHRIAQASIRVPEHDRDFVFATRDGQPLHARNVLHAYREALERAGLPRRSFHQLRHGYATLLLESGVELANISKVLGHSTFATTVDFYGHLTPGVSRRAAKRMGKILSG